MQHGVVDVFAFQEALLIEAVFGIVLLAMLWAGFRRWLQHKENIGRLIAEQSAERAAQDSARMEQVDARLKVVEQIVTDANLQIGGQVDAPRTSALPDSNRKRDDG